MPVLDRITPAPACLVIDLSEAEKDIYRGCGWKLARFVDDKLVELFNYMNVADRPTVEETANDALAVAVEWLKSAEGETWLVMCSCYQLCEPFRIRLDDAASLARLARITGDTFAEAEE